MPALAAYDNLLFGLLALQNGFIDQVQLVAAFQAWTREKSSRLAEQLVARGDIDAEQRALLDNLVSQHVKKHGGDPEKSLAALNPRQSTRERLASFRDADVEASLIHLGSARTAACPSLAMEANETFHTGVSEDFLLKEPKFKDLRDRLLKSASDFYGKLGALVKGHSDFASRRALGQANFELANLTSKVGQREAALAAHQQVLAYREALAAEPEADAESIADVGDSLAAVGDEQIVVGKTALAQASR